LRVSVSRYNFQVLFETKKAALFTRSLLGDGGES